MDEIMTWEEAKILAQQGIKVTHQYFTSEEYIIMRGNIIVFEDGVEIFASEWMQGKPYLQNNWSIYQDYANDTRRVSKPH
jgi:aromatic ring-opening dioxygenase LigB subunit